MSPWFPYSRPPRFLSNSSNLLIVGWKTANARRTIQRLSSARHKTQYMRCLSFFAWEIFHVLNGRNPQSKQSKTKTLGIFFPSHPLTEVTGATVKASNSHLLLTSSLRFRVLG